MAGKPRKRQSRKTGRTGRSRRGQRLKLWLPGRLGLIATACLAIFVGAALGYGLGLLNREEPKQQVTVAPQPRAPEAKPRPRTPPPPRPAQEATRGRVPAPVAKTPELKTEQVRPAPVPSPGEPAWIRNAVASNDDQTRPAIAIVIDDVGLNPAQTRKVTALPAPMTLAFLTYADRLPEQTAGARAAGHELLVHFPMEPEDASIDPGPNALLSRLNIAEIEKRLSWGLARFDGYVGINNHMGSRFTTGEAQMGAVLRELKSRGLLFLDSATSSASVGERVSRQLGLPHAKRDVFLDNSKDRSAIRASLALLEERARKQGHAIGIGHPYDETIEEVGRWIQGVRDRGFDLVPLSAVVRRNTAPPSRLGSRQQDPAG